MPKEGFVAPKERVNIVYRPETGGEQEEVELPLRLLIMGDFTGKPDSRKLEHREVRPIDKDNFDEILKGEGLGLNISVPNTLSGRPEEEINVKLKFESFPDFGPEQVAEQVPELKRLLELREALRSLRNPMINVPDFKEKIQKLIKDEGTRKQLLKEIGIEE